MVISRNDVKSRVGIFSGKKCFSPLAGFNRQKVAENGKKWKWPAGSLYMLLKASKHLHTQHVMSSGLTDCWYVTKCRLMFIPRHVRGSWKWITGSDPKDLDPGSVRIIDPTLTVCRQIHWDHRSVFAIRQEIHSDPRSKTSYCVWIHRDPRSEKRNSRIFYVLFEEINNILHWNINTACIVIWFCWYFIQK